MIWLEGCKVYQVYQVYKVYKVYQVCKVYKVCQVGVRSEELKVKS